MTSVQEIILREHTKKVDRYEPVLPDAEYRLLGMRSKIGGPFIRETKAGSEISAQKLNRVQKGDFIYSRLFAWQGSFGLVPEEMDGCHVSNEFPLFKVDTSCIVPEYLVFWFGLPHVQKHVEANCTGSTPGTRNRYKEEFFSAIKLLLPDVEEQRRIVAKIESLKAKINGAKQLRAEIQTKAQAVLHSAFIQIAEGAPRQKIRDLAPLERRPVEITMDGQYAELGVRSFGRGTFHKPTLLGVDLTWQKLFRVQEGDIVISNIKAWEGAIAVAEPDDEGRVGSHRYLTLVPAKGEVTAGFLCFYLLTDEGLADIGRASPGSADRNRTLGQIALEEIKVPVPAYEKQVWFSRLQAKVRELLNTQEEAEIELNAMLPSILDNVFNEKHKDT